MPLETVFVKEEPCVKTESEEEKTRGQDYEGLCGVSAAAAEAGLYTDHVVKNELVLGPELLHQPEPVQTQVLNNMPLETVFVKEEPSVKMESEEDTTRGQDYESLCGRSAVAAEPGLYTDHVVKAELVLEPETWHRPEPVPLNTSHNRHGRQQLNPRMPDTKRRKLGSNEDQENVVQCRATQKLENVKLEQNQLLTQQLRIYGESHECITPKVILHRNTDIPGDSNCLFHSLIRVLQLQISTCDLRRQLRDSPYLNSCHNPLDVYNKLSSNNEYGDLHCLYLFAKIYNKNICVHFHYYNVISKSEDTRFCHFKANDKHNWIHLDLRELHFTPYLSDDEKKKEDERKRKQRNKEYSKRYRDKKRTTNLQTGPSARDALDEQLDDLQIRCVRRSVTMCKNTRKCDCKPEGENIPTEGNVGSEDDDEPMDSDDDYYSESSSDEGASESDADSASGNRVTPDMIVWLMLKEQGFISQEKYDEKAEICEDDVKSLIPNLKKPESESSEDEADGSGDCTCLLEAFLEQMARMREKNNSEANGNVASQSETKDTPKDATEVGVCEDSNNVSDHKTGNGKVKEENLEKSSENANDEKQMEQTQTVVPDGKESNDEENLQNTVTTVHHEEVKHTVPKCLKCRKISPNTETMTDSSGQDENKDVSRENDKNLINENVTEEETNKNKPNDIDEESTSTKEAKIIDPKSGNESNSTTNKKTRSFKFILKHLVKENRISDEYEYVDVLATYVDDLDKQYKKNKAVEIFHKPSKDLKRFAFFLNFYSPSSYKYITETYNTPLPEHKVLCSWYVKDDEQPGLSGRAFEILKQKAAKKRLTCALMSRDIFMKNYGLDYDQVDYGGGCNFEYTDKAVMTFVFVLVSLDGDWKIPIGYIFAKSILPETHAELIRICLTQCHESGVDVVAITLDSPTPAEFLGCSLQDVYNLKTVFKHPVCDSEVAVWIDPCLAIRSARHTLKVKRVLYDDMGNEVRWKLIQKLWNLYSDEDIDFGQPKFLQLRNHIAKVGLTTEIFSDSLAPALEICEELFPGLFRDTAPTRRYIEIVNTVYDILNSKVTTNLDDVIQDLNTAKDYMIALFCKRQNALSPFDKENVTVERLQYRSFVEGKPVCGYIAFLICIESFKHMYATLVEKEQNLVSLNTHRLCKDHVENFVKNIRAENTSLEPEDFNGGEFQSFYDYLFDILETKPGFTDKNVKLEHWAMKNKYSPADIINRTSGKRAFDEVYSFQYRPKKLPKTTHGDRATNMVKEISKALDTEADLSTRKNMVGYLAGWIAVKFAKCLKCEVCIDLMCTDKKQWFHKFITSKQLKGVCLPSEEVFRICWECERALRMKISPARLRAWVLRRLVHQFPWASRPAKHSPQHHIHLARAVITKYIPLRVPAPLTSRDRQRVAELFNVFTCMNKDGFFSKLMQMSANEEGNELN